MKERGSSLTHQFREGVPGIREEDIKMFLREGDRHKGGEGEGQKLELEQ